MFPKTIKELCTPALAYFILGIISFVSLLAQNMSDTTKFCMGKMSCSVPHVGLVLFGKLLYIGFWTWALNALCRAGHKKIAWAIFFLPFIFFLVTITAMVAILASNK